MRTRAYTGNMRPSPADPSFDPISSGPTEDPTGNFTLGMTLLSGMLVLAGVSVLWIGRAFFSKVAA